MENVGDVVVDVRGQEERRGREERSVVDTSLQQPSLHLPFTGNPIFALLLWPFLSSRAKVLLYIYIYVLPPSPFSPLASLQLLSLFVRSRFSCRQLDLQSNRESRDTRLPGMEREGNFCFVGEEKPWIVVLKSR